MGQMQRSMTTGSTVMASALAAAAAASAAAAAARCWLQGAPHSSVGGSQTNNTQNGATNAPVLLLAEALAEPELGSPQMPTLGSVGHYARTCKPCAFYHTKGCSNGVECSFCHLCPAGEKKRRQKERSVTQREMHRAQFKI